MYLTSKKFQEQYPLYPCSQSEPVFIARGTYGSVYQSGDYVVKIFTHKRTDGFDHSFFREVDFYSRLKHPCISDIVAWTFDINSIGCHAMPIGINSIDAVREGLISPREIFIDILSALEFLHQNNVAHLDVKPENIIVYYEDLGYRAKLIDFGLAKEVYVLADERKYIRGVGFTAPYRHPEYNEEMWNPIEFDFYALAKTMYAYHIDDLDPYMLVRFPLTFETDDPVIDKFIRQATRLKSELPTTGEISRDESFKTLDYENLSVKREYIGYIVKPSLNFFKHHNINLGIILNWLIDVGKYFQTKTLFLALDLVHQTLHRILPMYAQKSSERDKIQTLGIACFILASIIECDYRISLEKWSYLSSGNCSREEIINMVKSIFICVNGLVFRQTYWHAAESSESLIPLLEDMVNFNYDVTRVRRQEGGETRDSKHISWYRLHNKYRQRNPHKKTVLELSLPLDTSLSFSHKGLKFLPVTESKRENILYAIEIVRDSKTPNDVYSLILNNRDKMDELSVNEREALYQMLRDWRSMGGLDILKVISKSLE